MITVAFFNNKGGVGKTSLLYHLSWALEGLGLRVLMADFDPQSNLTALCLDEDRLEVIWEADDATRQTIFGTVYPVKEELGDLGEVWVEPVSRRIGLVVGDIRLATFEAKLSKAWPDCLDKSAPAFRATSVFHRTIKRAAASFSADVALIDVGPNLGAINRAVLIAAEWIVTPLNADLFSIQGLRNLGPTLEQWREEWGERRTKSPLPIPDLPEAKMEPAGYIVVQPNLYGGRVTKAYQKWIERMPGEYRRAVGWDDDAPPLPDDPACLGVVKHYRSLMPLAHEARKPIFLLTPADGALGAHAAAAQDAGRELRDLSRRLAARIGLVLPV